MNYQVSRSGQTYGPYTSEDLQRYVASGNILPTDLAKSEEMSDWIPVSQILAGLGGFASQATTFGSATTNVVPAYDSSAYTGAIGQPAYGQPNTSLAASSYPDAPNLHWGLLVLLAVFTCGLGYLVFQIILLIWLQKVQPNAKALYLYLAYIGGSILQYIVIIAMAGAAGVTGTEASTGLLAVRGLFGITLLVLFYLRLFSERASLIEHFNGPEPVGLQLNGLLSFLFGGIYYQYHLNRINEMKKSARMMAARPY